MAGTTPISLASVNYFAAQARTQNRIVLLLAHIFWGPARLSFDRLDYLSAFRISGRSFAKANCAIKIG
jgi:hypothetical protein